MSAEGGRGAILNLDEDEENFLAAFESATLPEELFHHRDHVRLAWIYLRRHPPAAALARFSDGLKRFAAAIGKAGLYHETITWAYLLLIHERMERMERDVAGAAFDEFAKANPDLLVWRPSVLEGLYREETLASPLARRTFLLPDRGLPDRGLSDRGIGSESGGAHESDTSRSRRLGSRDLAGPEDSGGPPRAASR